MSLEKLLRACQLLQKSYGNNGVEMHRAIALIEQHLDSATTEWQALSDNGGTPPAPANGWNFHQFEDEEQGSGYYELQIGPFYISVSYEDGWLLLVSDEAGAEIQVGSAKVETVAAAKVAALRMFRELCLTWAETGKQKEKGQ